MIIGIVVIVAISLTAILIAIVIHHIRDNLIPYLRVRQVTNQMIADIQVKYNQYRQTHDTEIICDKLSGKMVMYEYCQLMESSRYGKVYYTEWYTIVMKVVIKLRALGINVNMKESSGLPDIVFDYITQTVKLRFVV
jgi:hypothetical protein